MKKQALYKTAAAAAAAAAAMFAAAPAHAFVYGVSHLELRNLALVTSGATTTVTGFNFNLNNTSELLGQAANSSATCNSQGFPACGSSTTSPVLNAAVVNAPGSTTQRSENNYTMIGTAPGGSYSNADSVINTAAVVQGIATSTQQIAESLLNTNGTASAGARVNSNTAFTYSMVVGEGANLAFSFSADADQRSQISEGPGSYLAGTAMSAVFTLNREGGGRVTWAPSGTAQNDCIITTFAGVTCSESADGENLNTLTSTGSNPGNSQNSSFSTAADFSAFGINISGLPAGNYTLVLEANTTTSLIRGAQVPEPGSIALVGLALAGLGVTTARRNKRAA